ncbi:hypothetical protein CROQUDRAFT_92254 [Cronartium quercuum f. sp. fusiforme G11]|uniref:Uncharacterized protein n=1 Tax=Cronartium quercuum f. sp. fusiforme G11 TaxID=708437 RepID=A0A9P6NJJ4_9BASI|nr:hypothetical protein CROQUDRAFT_92254 [Cronartium quercuum f. sp. fusiforme G11]
MPTSLATRTLARVDDGLNWITNQVLRNPDQQSIEYIILKAYFQIFLLLALLLSCVRLLTRRFPSVPQQAHPHGYSRLSMLADGQASTQGETNVDVFLDLPVDPCLPLEQLLHHIRSVVHDHRPALGLWDRIPKLDLHFYHNPPDENRLEKHWNEKALESLPSGLPLSHDRFVAVKPLLNDILEAATAQLDSHRILLISTNDRELVQYGIALLQSLPNPPLICYVSPIGSELPLELAKAADVVFEWVGHRFELVPKDHSMVPAVGDWALDAERSLEIFKPLELLLKAHGPPGQAQMCVSQLEGLLDHPLAGHHFLSNHNFQQYLRLALSMGVVGLDSTSSDAFDDDVFHGSTLVYLQPCITERPIQPAPEYDLATNDPYELDSLLPSLPVVEQGCEPLQLPAESDDERVTMSESERVTNSHQSSSIQLAPDSQHEPRPKPNLKHSPSNSGIELAPKKKRRESDLTVEDRPAQLTARSAHRRRRPTVKDEFSYPSFSSSQPAPFSGGPVCCPQLVGTPQPPNAQQPVVMSLQLVPNAQLNNISSPQLISTPSPQLSNITSPQLMGTPSPQMIRSPSSHLYMAPSPQPIHTPQSHSSQSPINTSRRPSRAEEDTVHANTSPTTERRSFDLEKGTQPTFTPTPQTPAGLWIRSWTGLVDSRQRVCSPLQEILRHKTYLGSPTRSRPFSIEMSSVSVEGDLEMEID